MEPERVPFQLYTPEKGPYEAADPGGAASDGHRWRYTRSGGRLAGGDERTQVHAS